MARRDPKVRDTKARVLDAALAVFGELGYQATSLEDVAERAGVTRGAVYYYFTDKDDLARDLQHELWEDLKTDALQAFDPELDTPTNLKRCFSAYLKTLQGLPQARFFLRDCWAVPTLEIAGRSDHDASAELLRGLLEEGMRRGEVIAVDADALARVLVGAYTEATLHVLTTGRAEPTVEIVGNLVDAFATGEIPARRGPVRPPAKRTKSTTSRGTR